MVQYATAAELASYLQKDLDTATADLVLRIASAEFSRIADTAWEPTSVTYEVAGGGMLCIELPHRPVTAVAQVRVNGVVVTGWTLVKNAIYREAGFGTACAFPPDLIAVDLTHGLTEATDDVKGAVLETGAQAYEIPVGAVTSESIDDYAVRYATTGGGLKLTASAQSLAEGYRSPMYA